MREKTRPSIILSVSRLRQRGSHWLPQVSPPSGSGASISHTGWDPGPTRSLPDSCIQRCTEQSRKCSSWIMEGSGQGPHLPSSSWSECFVLRRIRMMIPVGFKTEIGDLCKLAGPVVSSLGLMSCQCPVSADQWTQKLKFTFKNPLGELLKFAAVEEVGSVRYWL